MRKQATLLVAVFLCVGCTSMGRLEGGITAPTADESIFVLGVLPDNHRVMIFPGSTHNGHFTQNPWLPAKFYGGPQGGFIVGKAKAGSTLAITNVVVSTSDKNIFGTMFIACDQAKTLVFEAQAGKVTYLGSVRYGVTGSQLRIEYWNDLEAARTYVSGAYPALGESLEQGSYQLLPTTEPCQQTIYVPVYVPSSR